jgi:hypothetical protein
VWSGLRWRELQGKRLGKLSCGASLGKRASVAAASFDWRVRDAFINWGLWRILWLVLWLV